MLYAHAVAGNELAARFVYPKDPSKASKWAVEMLSDLRLGESGSGFRQWVSSIE